MFNFKEFINALLFQKPAGEVNDLKSATVWVQELPEDNIHQAQMEIIKALASLNLNKKTSVKERTRTVEYLDEKAQTIQDALCHDYLQIIAQSQAAEKAYLPAILGFWKEMANAYKLCIRAYASNPSRSIQPLMPRITARALYCFAMIAKWQQLQYKAVEPKVWRNLHRLYVFAESECFDKTAIQLYPHQRSTTTCASEYLRALLLYLARPESLLPRQIDRVDHWLGLWGEALTIEGNLWPQRQLYTVALDDGAPPKKLRRNMLGEKYRYLNLEKLGETVKTTIEQLKNGDSTIRIKLGEAFSLAECFELLELLSLRWSREGANVTRRHERQSIHKPAEAVYGFQEIIQQIKFTASTNTHNGLIPKDNVISANWTIQNESLNGIGAQITQVDRQVPTVGSLVGIRIKNSEEIKVGTVRRMSQLDTEIAYVGVEMVGEMPAVVELSPLDQSAPAIEAIYLPDMPEMATAAGLLLPQQYYVPAAVMRFKSPSQSYSIQLQQIQTQIEGYVKASFNITK